MLLSTLNCSCLLEISLSALLDKHFWKNYSGWELAHHGLSLRSQENHLCVSRRTGLCCIPSICRQFNKVSGWLNVTIQSKIPLLSKGLAFAGFWTLRFGFENKAWITPKYPIYLKNNKHVKKPHSREDHWKITTKKNLQVMMLYCIHFVTSAVGHGWGKASSHCFQCDEGGW